MSIAWGDYDNDGDLDLAVCGTDSSSHTIIYRNDGNGLFTDIHAPLQGVCNGSVAWGDYDNDGRLDLLVSGDTYTYASYGSTKIYHNDGDGLFTDTNTDFNTTNGLGKGVWGDFDNDGRLDLAFSRGRILRNTGISHNTAPNSPDGLQAVTSDNSVALSWNAATDAETPSAGLSYNIRVGTSPGASDICSPMADVATGLRRIAALGNAQMNLSWTLRGLLPGTYYWSVQAIDTAYAGSAWAAEQSFTVVGSVKINGYARTADGKGIPRVSIVADNNGVQRPRTLQDIIN